MFSHLTIKTKLVFATSFLCLSVIVIGAQGVSSLGITNASVKTMYEDRLTALDQLNAVRNMMQQNQMAIAVAALSRDPERIKGVIDTVGARRMAIDGQWKAFISTRLTAEEKKLAERFEQSRRQFLGQGIEPAIAALLTGDMDNAAEVARSQLETHYQPA